METSLFNEKQEDKVFSLYKVLLTPIMYHIIEPTTPHESIESKLWELIAGIEWDITKAVHEIISK